MMEDHLKHFYQKNLDQHGPSAQGVGWKNRDAQVIRFEQLMKLFTEDRFSLNDLGCGVGDFVEFAGDRITGCLYKGYDVMEEMVSIAQKKYGHLNHVNFCLIKDAAEMLAADYTIASGVFNIRFERDNDAWFQYILDTIGVMDARSLRGFAFNVLTKYSDKEYMRSELYYADPCVLFDFCKRNISKNVALLHDYNQYDFTIIVRKDN